jgi:hypothetical protein
MCTLTIIPWPAAEMSVRIGCNRDESRLRPAALPPQVRRSGTRRFVMPVDPVSDGTWIGVNDAGLAAMLLNAYPAAAAIEATDAGRVIVSRGTIIPSLLGSGRFDELLTRALELDTRCFQPFRLVLVDRQEVAALHWAGDALQLGSRAELVRPLMFTSSGLGDEVVDPPRRELFARSFHEPADWPGEQDAFHAARWPDAPELSVVMSRPEASTVSYTTIEILASSVTLTYYPRPPNEPSQATIRRLELT